MTALCQRVSTLKTRADPKVLWQYLFYIGRNNVGVVCRCFSTQGPELEKSGEEEKPPSKETRDSRHYSTHKKLSLFQKRLLYTSGKYDSIDTIPSTAGETELRYATDICKTLFNIWCMVFLASFYIFVHQIEKRRMRRTFARLEREEAKKMAIFDKINMEAQAKRKKSAV